MTRSMADLFIPTRAGGLLLSLNIAEEYLRMMRAGRVRNGPVFGFGSGEFSWSSD